MRFIGKGPPLGLAILWVFLVPASSPGAEASATTISGTLAGGYQIETVDGTDGQLDRGAVPFQIEISHGASEQDHFHAKLGFAAGSGLNGDSAFRVSPWAADTEQDVVDINGRNRDYLLTAWYRRAFNLGGASELALTGGIIDGTEYLDANNFANDEYTQFMNSALVNGTNFFAPSYDIGAALEFESGAWSVRGVVMDVGSNDEDRPFVFYGAEAGYRLKTGLGEGNYRAGFCGASGDFKAEMEDELVGLHCLTASFDQELGRVLGAWLRFGFQDAEALVDYANLWSGGLDIKGGPWGRHRDNIGLGLAHLHKGNNDVEDTSVFEAYYRVGLGEHLGATLDVQHMEDRYLDGRQVKGMIYGMRLAATF